MNALSLLKDALRDDISKSLGDDFDPRRFVPFVLMHEFEGLLFSDPVRFAQSIGQSDLSSDFLAIRNAFSSPEEINDSPDTAPSMRVKALYKGYQKPLMGVLAVEEIGLETIRLECPLFNRWIKELEQRAKP